MTHLLYNWLRPGFTALFFGLMAQPLQAGGHVQHRFWIMWEQIKQSGSNCPNPPDCITTRQYTTRLLDSPADADAMRTIGMLDRLALSNGRPVEHPEAPRICQNNDPELLLGFNPEKWELSERLDALRGLPGVYFSIGGLKNPLGYGGQFGQDLQAELSRRFWAAGIKVLSKKEMEVAPGQPQLNIYFSLANPNTGCRYSIFASLSQTMLLTRNIRTKLKVGTWGMSEGPSEEFPDNTEYDAILRVGDAFIADYWKANGAKTIARQ